MAKNSFALCQDHRKILDFITDANDFRLLIEVLFNYASGEYIDKKSLPPIISMAFTIIKIDLDKDAQARRIGKHHWNWKGGVSGEDHSIRTSAEYNEWRKSVFTRDDFRCQICCQRGGKLHAHHIKSFVEYPELRLDIDNGITLCMECHIEEHRRLRNA